MKLPKMLIVAGKTYRLISDKTIKGASFSGSKAEIRYSPEQDAEYLFAEILHEIIEAELAERGLRYKLGYTEQENGHLLFSFNHAQFEEAVKDIAFALKPFLK